MSILDFLFRPFAREQELQGRIYRLEIENLNLRKRVDELHAENLLVRADREDALAVKERFRADFIREGVERERWKRLSVRLQDEITSLCAQVANAETEGPKRDLEKFNDAQAARAMSRNTKQHFQAYQAAVKVILDRLDTLGQQNHVTKEDLRKLRELRVNLAAMIGREI